MRIWIGLFLVFALSNQARADDCLERFKALLAGNAVTTPVKMHITQEIVGSPPTQNWFYGDGKGNWMTEMIEPVAMQWTLFHSGRMYSSSDKGATWSFIRETDSEASKAAVAETLKSQRDTTSNTVCGTEEVEGTSYEVVSGEYISAPLQGAAVEQKYWVEPDTGWIARSSTHTKASGFEIKVTQTMEVQSDVSIPSP